MLEQRERIEEIIDVFEADGGELWRVLEDIAERPHRELTTIAPLVTPDEAESISPEDLAASIGEPDAVGLTFRKQDFLARGQKWRFLRVYDARNEISTDNAPNRFTAHFLRTLLSEVRRIQRQLEGASKNDEVNEAQLVEDARWLRRKLTGVLQRSELWLNARPLRDLPMDDQVLNHDHRYRRVMGAYIDLLG